MLQVPDINFAPDYLGAFYRDLQEFNMMYNMPANNGPIDQGRLVAFLDIINEEIHEAGQVRDKTDLADWLGDIMIYCGSEMIRNGIDPAAVLDIIMQSNFSKLGADQRPIYDERGKLMKGPNYEKPEPTIREFFRRQDPAGQDDGC